MQVKVTSKKRKEGGKKEKEGWVSNIKFKNGLEGAKWDSPIGFQRKGKRCGKQKCHLKPSRTA